MFWSNCSGSGGPRVGQYTVNLRSFEQLALPHVAPKVSSQQGDLKGESGLFLARGNAMGRRPYWPSYMETSCCTFRFGAIIRGDLHTLSLPCDSPCDNLHTYVIEVHAGKATHAKQNCLAGLATKKSGGTITHLHTWGRDCHHNRFHL